jgi:predicted small secreted protein
MKVLLLLMVVFSLVSCNTTIGVWRDTKAVFKWTANKISGSDDGGGGDEYDTEYGAPVY